MASEVELARVFISYARTEVGTAERLASTLSKLGHDVWWDRELLPHNRFRDVITSKITEASAVIVIWSADSIGSDWVLAEAELARTQSKLVQIAIDDLLPPIPFNQLHCENFETWVAESGDAAWARLVKSVEYLSRTADHDNKRNAPQDNPPMIESDSPAANEWEIQRQLMHVLAVDFKGYSRLSEKFKKTLITTYLSEVSRLKLREDSACIGHQIMGDFLVIAFSSPSAAASMASELSIRLFDWRIPKGLLDGAVSGFRIVLDSAIGWVAEYDKESTLLFGESIDRVARIEPVTPVGGVYCSHFFKTHIEIETEIDFKFVSLGRVVLPKQFGEVELFRFLPGD